MGIHKSYILREVKRNSGQKGYRPKQANIKAMTRRKQAYYHDRVKTITYDNGKEFSKHLKIAEALDADGYFAHPYHSLKTD